MTNEPSYPPDYFTVRFHHGTAKMIPYQRILAEAPPSLRKRLTLIDALARHTLQDHRAAVLAQASERSGPTLRETEPELAALWQWLILKYSADQPRVPAGNPDGGQWTGESSVNGSNVSVPPNDEGAHARTAPKVPNIQIAAGLRCDGFSSGCQSGGTYGTTGRYNINGRVLCSDCAIKFFGLQDEPQSEKDRVLRPFVIGK
jgi:hypothetical protein